LIFDLKRDTQNLCEKIDKNEKEVTFKENLMQASINNMKTKINFVEFSLMQELNRLNLKWENVIYNTELVDFIADYKLHKLKSAADCNFILKEKADIAQCEKLSENFLDLQSRINSIKSFTDSFKNDFEKFKVAQQEINSKVDYLLKNRHNQDCCSCKYDCDKRLNIIEEFVIFMKNQLNIPEKLNFPDFKTEYISNGERLLTVMRINSRKLSKMSKKLPYNLYNVLFNWPCQQYMRNYIKYYGLPASWISNNFMKLLSLNLFLSENEFSAALKYEKEYNSTFKDCTRGFCVTHRAKGPGPRLAI